MGSSNGCSQAFLWQKRGYSLHYLWRRYLLRKWETRTYHDSSLQNLQHMLSAAFPQYIIVLLLIQVEGAAQV